MSLPKFLRSIITIALLSLFSSCGNWGWESIETDNEEQLNIFGIISLDDSLESFIVVHKTLDTSGPDQIIARQDTVLFNAYEWFNEDTQEQMYDTSWYNPPRIQTIYESLYLVKDASVMVSDAQQSYIFERDTLAKLSEEYYWFSDVMHDLALYKNMDGSFKPSPNTKYSLDITTPGGLELNGDVTTPAVPHIYESELADTLSIENLFQLKWRYEGDFHTKINTGSDQSSWEGYYICGIDQSGTVEPGDTTWTSSLESWCYEEDTDPNNTAGVDLKLTYLDENYYRYFLATDNDIADISNFLIGEGGIGTSYGVEGGFGVFGAISADWTKRIARP